MQDKEFINNVVNKWLAEVCSEGMMYGPDHPSYEEYVQRLKIRNAIRVEEAEILRHILEEESEKEAAKDLDIGGSLYFAEKKGHSFGKKVAFGIRLKELVDKGIGTMVINEQSFAAYNYELTNEDIQAIVDHQDEIETMRAAWDPK